MARLLVLMGSGETTPTMVEVHKRILGRVGDDARLIDTPYGFQENADDLTATTLQYFGHNVGRDVTPIELRDPAALSPAVLEDRLAAAEQADWLFAGPGSPTYALRQWASTRFADVVRARLARSDTATVFASAAVCTVGIKAVPVYEVYKVGEAPHWVDGLDVMADIDLRCVVIPHFDNTEGRGHDTRFCYLGERRLAMMEDELAADVWVLGIDEHTAVTIDLDSGEVTIEGRGGLTVRTRGGQSEFGPDDDVRLDDLRRAGADGSDDASADERTVPAPPSPDDVDQAGRDAPTVELLDSLQGYEERFDAAIEDGQALAAADVLIEIGAELRIWAADTLQGDELSRGRALHDRLVVRLARTAQSGLHDHRDVVAPFVELLLALRSDARSDKDFVMSDRIRDVMADGDVEVRDTPDGATWSWEG